MKVLSEPGVLPQSERYFSTPSTLARQLFFYVTRCGHYYLNEEYDFRDSCEVGRMESHRTYLLDYVQRGAMHIEADGTTFTAEAGQLAITDCRRPHRYYTSGYTERIWIHIDGSNMDDFCQQILAFRGHRAFTPFPGSHTERTMTDLITAVKNNTVHSEADISQKIYRLLCGLLFPPMNQETPQDDPVVLALAYINGHLFEDLSIPDIAGHVGLSPSHFSRQFRSQTGFSPHEYIVVHRIDEAKALLHDTTLSVKEIAYRTGYHSEVNFITSFTGKVGVSPSAFRKIPL